MKLSHKIILCFVVAGAGVVTLFGICLMDDPPPEDADLSPRNRDIPFEENGFTYARQAAQVLYWPGYRWLDLSSLDEDWRPPPPAVAQTRARRERLDGMLAGAEAWDVGLAQEVVDRNARTVALLEKAVACPRFFFPLEHWEDYWLADAAWCSRLSWLMKLKSMHHLHQGNHEAAAADAVRLLRFGAALERGGGPSLVYLVGTTLKGLGLRRIEAVAVQKAGDPQFLSDLAERIKPFGPDERGLAETFRIEYQGLCILLEEVKAGRQSLTGIGSKGPSTTEWLAERYTCFFHLKLNRTKRLLAERMRMYAANANRHYAAMEGLERGDLPQRPRALILPSNFTGGCLVFVLTCSHKDLLLRKCQEAVRVESLRARLAIAAFKARTGRLPERLQEVVPEHLDAVPLDDFDGKPIRYSREKKILYCVGEDLKDDGGFTEEEGKAWAKEHLYLDEGEEPGPWQLPDPSWPIEFKDEAM